MQTQSLLIAISMMDFLSLGEKLTLLKSLRSIAENGRKSALEELSSCSYDQIARLAMRSPDRRLLKKKFDARLLAREAQASSKAASALGIKTVFYGSKGYPPLLREISDPPFSLFYRGSLAPLFGKCVSVVGTRRLCAQGKSAAHAFALEAASGGYCVVSGLAWGADGFAHRGAVDAFFDGRSALCNTVAVLAGGVDNIFPCAHKKLAASIIQNGGAIVSECPPRVPAEKWRFVQRNRIIAALSPSTVVIQAPPGSGSMITANFALDYNRELFFHGACFCREAMEFSRVVEKRLMAQGGRSACRKLGERPESYVESGAKVVSCFDEFLSFMC